MPKISAVVLTYNNEDIIGRCLESIKWVDEIIVIDSLSTDNTVSIARRHGAKVYSRPYQRYARTRNYSLGLVSFDWVLAVDSDEVYSKELAKEIKTELEKESPFCAYTVPFLHVCFGRPLYWWRRNNKKIRLFKKACAYWEDREVHPRLKFKGKVKNLSHYCYHYPYPNLRVFWEKFSRYTSWDACQLAKEKKKPSLVLFFSLLLKGYKHFLSNYLFQRAYRDGWLGFFLSFMGGVYYPLVYFKLLLRRQDGPLF